MCSLLWPKMNKKTTLRKVLACHRVCVCGEGGGGVFYDDVFARRSKCLAVQFRFAETCLQTVKKYYELLTGRKKKMRFFSRSLKIVLFMMNFYTVCLSVTTPLAPDRNFSEILPLPVPECKSSKMVTVCIYLFVYKY